MSEEKLSFKMNYDVASILEHAGKDQPEYDFSFSGTDLLGMAAQATFLTEKGFDIGFRDIYPSVKTKEEQLKGMKLMWQHKIRGFHHFKDDLVKTGFLSEEQAKWSDFEETSDNRFDAVRKLASNK